MTHQTNPELLNTVLQLLSEDGSGGFAEGIRLLVNEAMRCKPSPMNAPTPGSAMPMVSNPKPSPPAAAPSSSKSPKCAGI
jgi:hypothetical protein